MSKFKVGDFVRRVAVVHRSVSNTGMVMGQYYVVKSVDNAWIMLDNVPGVWMASKFELTTPATEASKAAVIKSPALAVQHGGDHYKKLKIQPVEYIMANGIPYMEGNVIKYISRWRDKGGMQDLKKAKHYIELLIENEEKNNERRNGS